MKGMCAYTRSVDFRGLREALRIRRRELGWTLDTLSEKSGVNRATIHSLENLKREPELKPQLETFEQLARAMDLQLRITVLRPSDHAVQNHRSLSDEERTDVAVSSADHHAAIALDRLVKALINLSIDIAAAAARAQDAHDAQDDRSVSNSRADEAPHRQNAD